ncbi:MAG: TolC family protein [Ferruginibacter sp.]
MKKIIFLMTVLIAALSWANAQRIQQVPDSIRRKYKVMQQEEMEARQEPAKKQAAAKVLDFSKYENDSLLRLKLIELALKYNPEMGVSDANIDMANAQLRYAKRSWLNSITAGSNVNEFVIQNSPAASFFPKYNVGVSIPFDIFSRLRKEKAVANGNIEANTYMKQTKSNMIKEEVQIRYENYKEMKELLYLQQESLEYDVTANEAAKKAYADGEIKLEDMNKAYQVYLAEKAKLVSRKRNYNAARIALEEYIGMRILDSQ